MPQKVSLALLAINVSMFIFCHSCKIRRIYILVIKLCIHSIVSICEILSAVTMRANVLDFADCSLTDRWARQMLMEAFATFFRVENGYSCFLRNVGTYISTNLDTMCVLLTVCGCVVLFFYFRCRTAG